MYEDQSTKMTLQLTDRHSNVVKNRKRPSRSRTSEKQDWTSCTCCCFGLFTLICEILLFGALGLVLFWVIHYQNGFAWDEKPELQFNYHPVLMIGGFVFLIGQAMLVHRVCRCCRRIYNKLWHTILHLLAMPAIAIGLVAIFHVHDANNIPHLQTMHSWMGLVTVGLFCLQFLVGFFTFLVLLCCDSSTANFRAALHPIHIHFGLATFLMGIATCLTGLRGKTKPVTSLTISEFIPKGLQNTGDKIEEPWVMNALAMTLVGVGLMMAFIIRYHRFQRNSAVMLSERL